MLRAYLFTTNPAQRAIICKIVSRAGARAIELTNVQPTRSPKCCVAVVGMGTEIHDEELQIIRDLKATGFRIIACGDGVESWSVKVRCLPLLAGAGQLLDKAAPILADVCAAHSNKRWRRNEEPAGSRANQIHERDMGMVGQSAAMMAGLPPLSRLAAKRSAGADHG